MQKFNVQKKKEKIYFSNNDVIHITKVLRKKIGNKLECIDQDNNLINVVIESINPFVVKIESILPYVISKTYPIDLYISLIKKKEFELVVEKLNELNVNSITPVYFQRTQGNIVIDSNRLNRIATESCKQCQRNKPILINKAISYKELIEKMKSNNNFIFANEKESSKNLDSVKINSNKNIGLIIGPEGGFTSEEINDLSNLCSSINLTNTILRAETAAIYLSSCVIEEIKKYEK